MKAPPPYPELCDAILEFALRQARGVGVQLSHLEMVVRALLRGDGRRLRAPRPLLRRRRLLLASLTFELSLEFGVARLRCRGVLCQVESV